MERVLKDCIAFLIIVIAVLAAMICYRLFDLGTYWVELFTQPVSEQIVSDDSEYPDSKTNSRPIVQRASLFMVGDALIHSAVYADAAIDGGYDFKPMLSEIKSIAQQHDLAFYNQETILGGSELGLSTYPCFNSPYEVGDAFIDAGFQLVSLANNHTLDRGQQAILNSRQYWNSKSVYAVGSYSSWDEKNQIHIQEINGIRYSLFAYTDWTNGLTIPAGKEYLLNKYSEELVRKDIESVRDQVDVVIVSMHFGDEYSFSISQRQRQIAEYLSSLGVDIIIGHHPHVVQPIEKIGQTLVIYSLGNFISAQRGVDRLTGMMFSMDLVKTVENGQGSIQFENMKAGLVYTYSDESNGVRRHFKVYPYQNLTDSLLPNHDMYYNKYMNLILQGNSDIERW